jgi:hypothetical protein
MSLLAQISGVRGQVEEVKDKVQEVKELLIGSDGFPVAQGEEKLLRVTASNYGVRRHTRRMFKRITPSELAEFLSQVTKKEQAQIVVQANATRKARKAKAVEESLMRYKARLNMLQEELA